MAEIVRDLGNRYGDLGSVLVKHQAKLFVVSGTTAFGPAEWGVFPANAHGAVLSWTDISLGRDTREQAMAALEDICHCGAPLRGSAHCVAAGGCGCEQYERYCDAVYDPDADDDWMSVEDWLAAVEQQRQQAAEIARLRAELEG